MKRSRYHLVALVLLAGLVPLFAADQKYTVKFERPSHKGDAYGVTIESAESQDLSMINNADGSVMKKQGSENRLKLEADVRVLEVSPGGTETSSAYTIRSFTDMAGKDAPAILKKGTVVNARKEGGKTVFYIDNMRVGDVMEAYLKEVISMSSDDGDDDDRVFGTKADVAVGEKWKIDAPKAADMLRSETVIIDNKDIDGYACIQEIVNKSGRDCMKVVVEINIGYLTFPLPETVKSTSSTAKIYIDGLLPVDTTRGALSQSAKMDLSVNARGKLNESYPDVSLVIIAKMSRNIQYRY